MLVRHTDCVCDTERLLSGSKVAGGHPGLGRQ